MGFTSSQKKAIEIFGKNVIVSAGAGSGKTTVLSEKVKYLIKEKNMHVEEMLILTFTDLAASEMRDRIRNILKKEYFDEALKVDTADICTFDAFALSLVKKYHLLLGLNEDISLVSDPIIKVKRKKWIDELFLDLYEKEDEEFISLLNRLTFKKDNTLKELIEKIIEKSSLSMSIEEYFSPTDYDSAKKEFDKIFSSLEHELFDIKNRMYDAFLEIEHEGYKNKVYNMNANFFEANNYDDLISSIDTFSLSGTSFKLSDEDKISKENFMAIKEEFDDFKGKLSTKEAFENEYIDSIKYKNYLKKLAKIIYDKEEKFKNDNQVFSFSDIAYFAYKIVKENDDVRNSLKEKYKIIMVDEYQDTSYSQERFLKLIEHDNMFMVGDIKQSIYRFRNARPDIFKQKYDNYSQLNGGEKIDLNDNFRSRKEVLNDINLIFKEIMTDEYGSANYRKDHMILPGNKDYDTTSIIPPVTEAIIYEEKKDMIKAEIEANLIAEDILKKIKENKMITKFNSNVAEEKKVSFSSFCIIQSNKKFFPVYKKVFEKKGIPLFIQSNEIITNNHLIKITINALLLISKMINEIYDDEFNHLFVSLARSFIFSFDDEKIFHIVKTSDYKNNEVFDCFKNIVSKIHTSSLEEIINLFFDETDLFYKLLRIGDYEKNKCYFESFISYFKEMDVLDYTIEEAVDFLQNIEKYQIELTLPSLSTSEDAVKLINAHKSKGLEYPIVYFSSLFNNFNETEYKKKENVSSKYGITFSLENGYDSLDHFMYKRDDKKEQLSEEIRIFYVALTRAKEQMIFVYPEKNKYKNIKLCRNFLEFLKSSKLEIYEEKREILGLKNEVSDSFAEKRLEYEEITFDVLDNQLVRKSSKSLSPDSSYSSLNLGTKIHFLFQTVDFKNRDYSFVSDKDKKLLKRFFESEIYQIIKDGEIYKEYPFEIDDVKGVIDLFAIKDNEIILVDYKLKDLSPLEYRLQIKDYSSFLSKTFKKPVKAYLYAVFTGEIEEIKD